MKAALGEEALCFSVDTKNGKVAVRGWKDSVDLTPEEAITWLEDYCAAFLYTHVDTEGTMQGFPADVAAILRSTTAKQLIVAGGIKERREVDELDAHGCGRGSGDGGVLRGDGGLGAPRSENGAMDMLQRIASWEQTLLWPAPETTTEQIDALLAPEFHEIGASGRRFDRAFGLATLLERRGQTAATDWVLSDRRVDRITEDVVLHTYRLQRQDGQTSRRSTLWRRADEGWMAVFHQGTPDAG